MTTSRCTSSTIARPTTCSPPFRAAERQRRAVHNMWATCGPAAALHGTESSNVRRMRIGVVAAACMVSIASIGRLWRMGCSRAPSISAEAPLSIDRLCVTNILWKAIVQLAQCLCCGFGTRAYEVEWLEGRMMLCGDQVK